MKFFCARAFWKQWQYLTNIWETIMYLWKTFHLVFKNCLMQYISITPTIVICINVSTVDINFRNQGYRLDWSGNWVTCATKITVRKTFEPEKYWQIFSSQTSCYYQEISLLACAIDLKFLPYWQLQWYITCKRELRLRGSFLLRQQIVDGLSFHKSFFHFNKQLHTVHNFLNKFDFREPQTVKIWHIKSSISRRRIHASCATLLKS